MTQVVALDAEALTALTRSGPRRQTVRAALEAARRLGREVVLPTLVLTESYRGRAHAQAVDSLLARETGFRLRDTDRQLARLVGGLLTVAGMGSDAVVDAHVVAVAAEAGGGVVLTGDVDDLERLTAGAVSVTVAGLD